MPRKIETLPEELERRLPEIRDEWMRIGLSTEPANRELAEKGVNLAYKAAGLEPPKTKIWVRSPLEGASEAVSLEGKALVNVKDKVEIQVRDQVWDQITAQDDQVWLEVEAQVRDKVEALVKVRVWEQVMAQIDEQIGGDLVSYHIHQAGYGQHNAGMFSFYSVFEKLVPETQKLEGLWLLAQNCGWYWPFEDIVILTDRPKTLLRNEAGKLHSENGPSLEYRDGFGLFSWHGYRIPNSHHWIITDKQKLNPETINGEENAELRRIMLEIYSGL